MYGMILVDGYLCLARIGLCSNWSSRPSLSSRDALSWIDREMDGYIHTYIHTTYIHTHIHTHTHIHEVPRYLRRIAMWNYWICWHEERETIDHRCQHCIIFPSTLTMIPSLSYQGTDQATTLLVPWYPTLPTLPTLSTLPRGFHPFWPSRLTDGYLHSGPPNVHTDRRLQQDPTHFHFFWCWPLMPCFIQYCKASMTDRQIRTHARTLTHYTHIPHASFLS